MHVCDEKELSEAIVSAEGPLRIIGGGTRGFADTVSGTELSTLGLNGVRVYEPGALTLVVGAGTPVSEVEALLQAQGQRLAFEPMDHRGLTGQSGPPTIGGMAAANVSGPRRIQVGACRDFLLGVRFVDGAGRIIKNGGRVMKNVTGYDLVKLMAGSFGTLGVLSELSLKVLPAAETAATLRIEGLDDSRAIEALAAALAAPFDVSGAAHTEGATLLRLEGFAQSVSARAKKLATHLSRFGPAEILDHTATDMIWKRLRDVVPFHDRPGNVWRISVKPSDGPRIGAALRDMGEAQIIYDWGGGLVWALLPDDIDARAALQGIRGHARLERANLENRKTLGVFAPESAVIAQISAGLRARFDHRGILNPGLMQTAKRG